MTNNPRTYSTPTLQADSLATAARTIREARNNKPALTADGEAVYTDKEASDYLRMSPSFLRQGRMNGSREKRCPPPPWIKIGRSIRYLKSDLDAWLQENRKVPKALAELNDPASK